MKSVPEDWQRAIAVVAHPDDLEYGASSAIARWSDPDFDADSWLRGAAETNGPLLGVELAVTFELVPA